MTDSKASALPLEVERLDSKNTPSHSSSKQLDSQYSNNDKFSSFSRGKGAGSTFATSAKK